MKNTSILKYLFTFYGTRRYKPFLFNNLVDSMHFFLSLKQVKQCLNGQILLLTLFYLIPFVH
jgi:hypothetical protein